MIEAALPKISIVMPVLNRVSTIEKAIRSVLDQQYPNLELIIIDGGSTDGTVDVIRRYAEHIAYWHSKPDGSSAVAANYGIEKATGEYVALLMADDWYGMDALNCVGKTALANPQADMLTCGGSIVSWDEEKQVYYPKLIYTNARRLSLSVRRVCFDDITAICCRFVRKSLYESIGVFNPFDAHGKHRFSNDREFLLRVTLHRAKNVYVNVHGHYYLASAESATFGNHKENILRICHEHMEIADNYLANAKITYWQRFLLRYWYHDQATRLVLYAVLDGEWRAARQAASLAAQDSLWFWPAAFFFTTIKILLKKAWRFMRR